MFCFIAVTPVFIFLQNTETPQPDAADPLGPLPTGWGSFLLLLLKFQFCFVACSAH